METRNKLTGTGGEGMGDKGGKKEKGLVKELVSINDPWTWTTGWGLTVGVGGGWQGRTTG